MDPKSILRNEWMHLILTFEVVKASVQSAPFNNPVLMNFAYATQLAFIKLLVIRFYDVCFSNQNKKDEFSFYKNLKITLHFKKRLGLLRHKYAHIKKSEIPQELQITLKELGEWFVEAENALEVELGEKGIFENRHVKCQKIAEDGWKALS